MATPIRFPTVVPKKDPTKLMVALEWHGPNDIRVAQRPKPLVTDPGDAIIKISSTTICGSDLHLYHNEFSGMKKGDVLGHECMGFVTEVGPDVKQLKPGDRVVVSAVIADGVCNYCKMELYSCCDGTNPSTEMEKIYGHRTAGIFGYSHLTGGYDGGQAEFIRVPLADMNCLKVPDSLRDEQVLFLSDIVCTGYHATELGQVSEGQTVAVWGCGPVGLMALAWCKFKGAKRLIAIDAIPYRLQVAADRFGAEIINFAEQDVIEAMRTLVPGGPDVAIDAVGFRFPKSLLHKLERMVKLETDSPEVLKEAILTVRKGGKISVVGDYYAYTNNYPIGAWMEKGLTMSGGQVHVQKYWKKLLEYIQKGEFDPTFVITHYMPLEQGDKAYRLFDNKEDNALKIILKPDMKAAP